MRQVSPFVRGAIDIDGTLVSKVEVASMTYEQVKELCMFADMPALKAIYSWTKDVRAKDYITNLLDNIAFIENKM